MSCQRPDQSPERQHQQVFKKYLPSGLVIIQEGKRNPEEQIVWHPALKEQIQAQTADDDKETSKDGSCPVVVGT